MNNGDYMDKVLDFNDLFFGDLGEYKKIGISLLESLKNVSAVTLWSMEDTTPKGLSTIMAMKIIELLLNSLDKVGDNLYANDLIAHEFPLFMETKEMIELLLYDPLYDSDEYLNLAITLFSEFFTLLEVKLLLFDGCSTEMEASDEVYEEYDIEIRKYMGRLDKYRDEFIALHS